jgi:hypothetical protein
VEEDLELGGEELGEEELEEREELSECCRVRGWAADVWSWSRREASDGADMDSEGE